MMEEAIIYYHDDMDGICSAAIVKTVYPDAKCVKCNYDNIPEININDIKDKIVFVVDFSFDSKTMQWLKKESRIFCWCDHHKSAMERNPELWESDEIDGLRSLDKSGCELTWEWFSPHKEAPLAVKLVGDYDMWKFKYLETKLFGEIASLKFEKPEDMVRMFDNKIIPSMLKDGELLLTAKHKRVEKTFNNGFDITFCGYDTRRMNSNNDISELGNYACKQGYKVGMVWFMKGENIIVGLRSIGDVDVSEVAKKFGGGGHRNASGFTVPWWKFNMAEVWD